MFAFLLVEANHPELLLISAPAAGMHGKRGEPSSNIFLALCPLFCKVVVNQPITIHLSFQAKESFWIVRSVRCCWLQKGPQKLCELWATPVFCMFYLIFNKLHMFTLLLNNLHTMPLMTINFKSWVSDSCWWYVVSGNMLSVTTDINPVIIVIMS